MRGLLANAMKMNNSKIGQSAQKESISLSPSKKPPVDQEQ